MPATQTPPPELSRELGLSTSLAVVVGTVIGSGIFLVPAEMMQAAGSAKLVYLAWVVGGVLSFFGALTYAELGAMKPQAGGEYVYIRDAYGPLPGFLYAWTWFVIAKPASIATLTTGLVRVLGTFAFFGFLSHALIRSPFSFTYGQLLAIGATLFVTFLNYLGIKKAGEFQLVFTMIKVSVILTIVVTGLSYSAGSWQHFATTYAGAEGGMAGFMAALVAALWAYDGWNDLSMVSGEIRNPERNIPISLIAGVAIVGALYILTNVAVQYVLPPAAIAGTERPASDATGLVLGWRGAWLVSAGMALSILVAMNGTIMSAARVPYAAARDRYFFSALAEVHPRFHSPAVAIVAQGGFSILLLFLGGSYKQFFSLAIFSEWLFYLLAASTLFVFRRREPQAHRPYRVWGYPWVPVLFIAVAGILLFYTFADNLVNSGLGCIVILAGIPVFLFFARRRTV
jgi:APA family basic amino acid/polyamine antiporter